MRALNLLAEGLRIIALVICVLLFGSLALLVIDALYGGAIEATLLVAAIFAPIIRANNLLWGRRYPRRLRQQEIERDV
jgi:hypothetical protein